MTSTPAPGVTARIQNAVATVTLANPGRKNALTPAMWTDLARIIREMEARDDVAVLVISGHGGDFSTGIDLHEQRQQGTPEKSLDESGAVGRAEAAVIACAKPVIAAISGYCVGGGLLLALACDLRIAGADSAFAITPAKIGVVYPAASIQRLVGQIGPSAAKRMLFTAEFSDADHALRVGLVDEVTEATRLELRALEVAAVIAGRSQLTVQAVKDIVETVTLDPAGVAGRERLWMDESLVSSDQQEGLLAFSERRRPQFTWKAPSTPIPPRTASS